MDARNSGITAGTTAKVAPAAIRPGAERAVLRPLIDRQLGRRQRERNHAPPLFRESVVCQADLLAELRWIVRCQGTLVVLMPLMCNDDAEWAEVCVRSLLSHWFTRRR